MFNKSIDDRLSCWAQHRSYLETCENPLEEACNFWKDAPFVPYNNKVDQFNQRSWPSPWEIIVQNKYDDFTKALMIGQTLKFTDRFKNSKIEIRTLVDRTKNSEYHNVVCVDNWALNYKDNGPIEVSDIPSTFSLENFIDLDHSR